MGRFDVKRLAEVVKASADPNRIRILHMLRRRKMCVCEIAHVLGIAQPSVSRHLKKLKQAGFLTSGSQGLWTLYTVHPQNRYARVFLERLGEWIADPVTAADDAKARRADREGLCRL